MRPSLYTIRERKQRVQLLVLSIIRCTARGRWTVFYAVNGRDYMECGNLGKVFLKLAFTSFFYLTHKSHVINMLYFDHYDPTNFEAVLLNGERIPVARTKRAAFNKFLHEYYYPVMYEQVQLLRKEMPPQAPNLPLVT